LAPTIRSFMDAHHLIDVTVVADAGMVSATNQKANEEAGAHTINAADPCPTTSATPWTASTRTRVRTNCSNSELPASRWLPGRTAAFRYLCCIASDRGGVASITSPNRQVVRCWT
jgi:hypothetical protein